MNETRRKLFNIPEMPMQEVEVVPIPTPAPPINIPIPPREHYTLISRYISEPDGYGIILSYMCLLDGIIDNMTLDIGDPNADGIILTAGERGQSNIIPIVAHTGRNVIPGEVVVNAGMVVEVKWVSGPGCSDIHIAFRYRTRE